MPAAEFILLVGLFGLAVGSFLNVCIDRLPRNLSIVALPSHCERCQHPLAPLDMMPLLSYLWLRGKCRYCKASFPVRIPVVETTTGLLFAYVSFRYEATIETVVVLAFVGVLVVVFFIDLEHNLILNRIMYPSIVAGLLLAPFGPLGDGQSALQAYLYALLGALVGAGVLYAIYLAARGGFGGGDVKLGGFLGAMLGVPKIFVALPMSFVAGGLVGIALIIFKVRSRKDTVPFGPFLAGAALVTLFWGEAIFDWYKGLFPV